MIKRAMMVLLVALFVLAISGVSQAQTIRAAGATIVQAVVDKLARPFEAKNPGIKITTAGGGSTVAITSAAEGAVEIGMPARRLTSTEARMYPNAKLFVFAKDGVAVVVHPTNPVRNLTTAQLREIFSGKLTDWGPVGGKGAINVVIRERGSGTRVAFEDAILGKEKVTGRARIGGSTGDVRRMIAADPLAIGYVVIGSVDASLKALNIDDKVPTLDNVKAGTYTLTAPFYLVTDGEPKGPVKAFIDFVMSPEGQAIVEKEKLIPVRPTK
jgi:phosphate transport system substrate-binding protein